MGSESWLRHRIDALLSPDTTANDLYRILAGPAWCRGLDADAVRDEIWCAAGLRPTATIDDPEIATTDWRIGVLNRAEIAKQCGDTDRLGRLRRIWVRLEKKETRQS